MRDAWTAAYTPSYTAVVWFGRADGGPDARLIGLSLAAPAALTIQRLLNAGIPPREGWYQPPHGAKRRGHRGQGSRLCPFGRGAFSLLSVHEGNMEHS